MSSILSGTAVRYRPLCKYLENTDLQYSNGVYEKFSKHFMLSLFYVPQGTCVWSESRGYVVGATTTARLFGIGYGTIEKSIQNSRTIMKIGEGPYTYVSAAMKRGSLLEDEACDLFQKQMNLEKIYHCGMTANKAFYGIFGCSPDGIFTLNGELHLIEIKCPWIKRDATDFDISKFLTTHGYDEEKIRKQLIKFGKVMFNTKDKYKAYSLAKEVYKKSVHGKGVLPQHWLQMQHQFASTGVKKGYYVVYKKTHCGKQKLFKTRVTYDEDLWVNHVWPRLYKYLAVLHEDTFVDNTILKNMKDKQDYFKDKQMDERAAELKTLFKHDTIDLKETVIDIHSYTEIHTSV